MLSRSVLSRALALAAFAALSCSSLASAQAKVLATVNGAAITDKDVAAASRDIGPTLPPQLQGAQRQSYILTYLIDLKLVAQKAAAQKLDQKPAFARQLAYYHDKVLMQDLLADVAQKAATKSAVKQAYDAVAKAQKPETQIHARHILVKTEAEAEAARKRIKGGESFSKVAKEVSKDGSGNGGDLGWFTKGQMTPAFSDAAFKLSPGQISQPVKTQFGWHIIQVLGKRTKPFPAFDKVEPQVKQFVEQKAQGELIAQLRKGAKIQRFDTPPAPPAPPAGVKPSPSAPASPGSAPATPPAQPPGK